MPSSARISGNKKPVLKLGSPGTEYAADLISGVIENDEAENDTLTYGDVADGATRQFFFRGSAIQSTAAGSLWTYAWENTSEEVPATYAPHGNATPSVAEPHVVFTVKVGPKPAIGGEVSTSRTASYTFDFEWEIIGEPTLDTGA